jgi:GntR family transcriptional regulator, transcriptional repressor for pyruvate dehydrogenase complex
MFEFRRGSLSEQIVEVMQKRIHDGEYAVGEKLPSEHDLIGEFGVSRTVIREAIASLRASGLVVARQGVGVFVQPHAQTQSFRIEGADLAAVNEAVSVLELRIALEVEAAALAALRREQSHLDAMKEAMTTMASAISKGEDSIQADLAFHRAIGEATGNQHFLKLFNYLGELLIPRTRLRTFELTGQSLQNYLDSVNREHQQIYSAIEQRDGESARGAMRLHLIGSKERLQRGATASAE